MTPTSQEVPLPEPGLIYMGLTGNPEHAFSAAQMLAYATARTAALEERVKELEAEGARLDFVLKNDAFIVWTNRDGSIKQCQLFTQNEDEEYTILSGEHRFFSTPRAAIDTARGEGGERHG